jgi:FKBP-type peptidyl-prolyl cis-trans isomerase FkpA
MQKAIIGLIIIAALAALGFFYLQKQKQEPKVESAGETPLTALATAASGDSAVAPAAVQDTGELQIFELKEGTGETAVAGKTVMVHYTGTLLNGTKFDSSKDRNQPFPFTLGAGQVIQGWDSGVAGMKVGGTRKLVIPSKLGYGAAGAGGVIPPNATLVFEVELLEVK